MDILSGGILDRPDIEHSTCKSSLDTAQGDRLYTFFRLEIIIISERVIEYFDIVQRGS